MSTAGRGYVGTASFNDEAVLGNELGCKDEAVKESIANLESELCKIERRENSNTNAEAQLLLDKNLYNLANC